MFKRIGSPVVGLEFADMELDKNFASGLECLFRLTGRLNEIGILNKMNFEDSLGCPKQIRYPN